MEIPSAVFLTVPHSFLFQFFSHQHCTNSFPLHYLFQPAKYVVIKFLLAAHGNALEMIRAKKKPFRINEGIESTSIISEFHKNR